MITSANLYSGVQSPALLPDIIKTKRGDPGRCISAADLINFGRCPKRWLLAPDPEDPLAEWGPTLVEWLVFAPETAKRYFIRRPDTYEAMRLECPRCHSEGPARSCTKCGTRRSNVVRPRPWTSAAKQCAAWAEKHELQGRRIIAPREWDRASRIAEALASDPAVRRLGAADNSLRTILGRWHDDATNLDIPVWTRCTVCPANESAAVNALVQLVNTSNADPGQWEAAAFSSGAHVRAALTLALWNQCGVCDCREFLWLLAERDDPFLYARRRASQELLAEGRKRLEELIATYATALANNTWPGFDVAGDEHLNAWSLVALQPWMTSGAGAHGGYFAPTAPEILALRTSPNDQAS